MNKSMSLERATAFGEAWNSGDPDLVVSYFTDDGVYHASVGPDHLGKSYHGKDSVRKGVQAFFDHFPGGRFENLKVVISGDHGTFEWDFISLDAAGKEVLTAGCDLLEFDGELVTKKNAFRKAR